MVEIVLNSAWLALAGGSLLLALRRPRKISIALLAAVVLLFPIISVSDDLTIDRETMEESLALIVACFALLIGLAAVARVEPRRERPALLFLTVSADPRSPPRA